VEFFRSDMFARSAGVGEVGSTRFMSGCSC